MRYRPLSTTPMSDCDPPGRTLGRSDLRSVLAAAARVASGLAAAATSLRSARSARPGAREASGSGAGAASLWSEGVLIAGAQRAVLPDGALLLQAYSDGKRGGE